MLTRLKYRLFGILVLGFINVDFVETLPIASSIFRGNADVFGSGHVSFRNTHHL